MRKLVYVLLAITAAVLLLSFSACQVRDPGKGELELEVASEDAVLESEMEEEEASSEPEAEESESELSEEDAQSEAVEQAVHDLMKVLQSGNRDAIRNQIDYTNLFQLEIGQADTNLMAILQRMQYEILEATVDGSNATVKVNITNVDMHQVLPDYFQQANALYYNNALSDAPLSDAAMEEQVEALFITALDAHATDTVSRTVDLMLRVENGIWRVQSTADFRTAAFGDFWSAQDAIQTVG